MSGVSPVIDLLGSSEDLLGDPSDFVRKCDDDLIAMHALFELGDPCSQWMTLPVAGLHTGAGSMDQYPSKIGVPRLLMPSSVVLPPVEYPRGVSPSQAAKNLPFANQ